MLEQLGNGLTAVFALLAIAASGVATTQMGVVKSLREAADDLRKRDTDHKQARAEQEAKIAQMGEKLRVLADVVTGEAHLVVIEGKVDANHRAEMERLRANHVVQIEAIQGLSRDLGDLRECINREDS